MKNSHIKRTKNEMSIQVGDPPSEEDVQGAEDPTGGPPPSYNPPPEEDVQGAGTDGTAQGQQDGG